MACEVYPLASDNIMIIFYLYKGDQLHYFTHITVNNLSDFYTLIRNTGKIDTSLTFDLSKDLFYAGGVNNDSDIVYNVPQYQTMLSTDDYEYTEHDKSVVQAAIEKLNLVNERRKTYLEKRRPIP